MEIIQHAIDLIRELFRKEEVIFILMLFGLTSVVILPVINGTSMVFTIFKLFLGTWWLWFFFILFPFTLLLWTHWRQELFKRNIEWVFLEIHMPREIIKSPRAMEQVLGSIHTLRNSPGTLKEKYWDGEVTRWSSLEIVSLGGQVHFYIRVPASNRNVVEAAFFSYYHDIEIREVDDYAAKLPMTVDELQGRGLELWGTELQLAREEAYPIRTYSNFEDPAEEKQFDPISSLLEILGKVKPGEVAGIQIILAPADKDWKDTWKKLLEELQKPKTVKIEAADGKKESAVARTPGQLEIIEEIERNFSKAAFHTIIRLLYCGPRDGFYKTFPGGLIGAFNQYSALHLNAFKPNSAMGTKADPWKWPYVFAARRTSYRKGRHLYNYRKREIPPQNFAGRFITSYFFNFNFASRFFFMNTECVATIFHPPTAVVLTAPHIRRVESRKAGPPAGLAIFGEESEIEKFH